MNRRIFNFWGFLSHYKYLIVIVVGVLVVGFLDENSIMKDFQYRMKISELESDIKKYNDQNAADTKQLRELKTDPRAIEKIARERYFMKADDEDIYVLSDDEKPADSQNEKAQ